MKQTAILAPANSPRPRKYADIRATPLFPLVSLALVVANLAIWFLLSSAGEPQASAVVDSYGFIPVRLTASLNNGDSTAVAIEALRSVSSTFVHEHDFSHVGLNMLFLFLFGMSVERQLGRLRFAALYILAGSLTCFAYFAICPDGLASYGASSAVCGVLGAYILIFLKKRPFSSLLVLAVLALNVYCAITVTQIGFTFFAHLIGALIGFLAAACMTPRRVTIVVPNHPGTMA